MKKNILLTAAILFSLSLFGQEKKSSYESAFDLPGSRSEVYKTIGSTKLKVYIYEPKSHKANSNRPAIVFFFGGGWRGGTPKQFQEHCRYLASMGMVAMTADYRVFSRRGRMDRPNFRSLAKALVGTSSDLCCGHNSIQRYSTRHIHYQN